MLLCHICAFQSDWNSSNYHHSGSTAIQQPSPKRLSSWTTPSHEVLHTYFTCTCNASALHAQIFFTNPHLLCQKCYQNMYQLFLPPTNCASCVAVPKAGTRFCHHSPDAHIVPEHLRNTMGSGSSI